MAKMSKKWVALCSTAIGAIYAAGYFTTETQASIQQAPQALAYSQGPAAAAPTADPDYAATSAPAATPTPAPEVTVPTATTQAATAPASAMSTPAKNAPVAAVKAAPVPSAQANATSAPSRAAIAPVVSAKAATAPAAPAKAMTASAASAPSSGSGSQASSRYKNGTFHGTGSNRRGAIQVAVTIQNDKITDVEISRFAMHYSEDDVVGLPKEVLQLQSAQVRNVSGATYSTDAFKDAVKNALFQARNA